MDRGYDELLYDECLFCVIAILMIPGVSVKNSHHFPSRNECVYAFQERWWRQLNGLCESVLW